MRRNISLTVLIVFLLIVGCSNRKTEYEYHEDGSVKTSAETLDGKLDGVSQAYDQQGNRTAKFDWKNDQLHGSAIHYFPDGKVEDVTLYNLGKKEGLSEKYNQDGRLLSTSLYKNDRLVEKNFYFPSGQLLERHLYDDNKEKIYVAKYDSTGDKRLEIVPPLFRAKKDTIEYGETYSVEIYFGLPLKGQISVYTGRLDSNRVLTDTLAVPRSDDGRFYYEVIPNYLGTQSIPFVFRYYTDKTDTLNIDGMVVKHTFFVEDNRSGT